MQIMYKGANEKQKDEIRQATFEEARSTLSTHYPNKRVYLVGQEQPNSIYIYCNKIFLVLKCALRLGLEFNDFWKDTERWRLLPEQMPKEEEPMYKV